MITFMIFKKLLSGLVAAVSAFSPAATMAGENHTLNSSTNYTVAWMGGSDTDRLTFSWSQPGNSVQLVDADCGGTPNDLLVSAAGANADGLTGNGAVYLIRNVSGAAGMRILDGSPSYTVRWSGGANGDNLTNNTKSGQTVQLVNVDGGPCANDLLLSASNASALERTTSGALWLVKNIDQQDGDKNLGEPANFDAVWYGGASGDRLGSTQFSGQGVSLVATDDDNQTNDLFIAAPWADVAGLDDNGAVYMIKDVHLAAGVYDLADPAGYTAAWHGGASGDFVGFTGNRTMESLRFFDTDSDDYGDDLLINAPLADMLGRTDNGAVYLLTDTAGTTGLHNLSDEASFAVAWAGASAGDQLSGKDIGGYGSQFLRLDVDGRTDDLLMVASLADVGGPTDNGVIYLAKDVPTLSGLQDLSQIQSSTASWYGGSSGDMIGNSYSPTMNNTNRSESVQVFSLDNDGFADDLIIPAPYADTLGRTDNGAIYMLKNIGGATGSHDLVSAFDARWSGGADGDYPGATISSGPSVKLFDGNGDARQNDLLIFAPEASVLSRSNNGAIYLIENAHLQSGDFDFGQPSGFKAAWAGGASDDHLGATFLGGASAELVNFDGGPFANDLLIPAVSADYTRTDNGAIYYVQNANERSGWQDLAAVTSAKAIWYGANNGHRLGWTFDSGTGIQVVDIDNDGRDDDLILTSVEGSLPGAGAGKSGAVYLVVNAGNKDGAQDLALTSSYTKAWFGAQTSDRIGRADDSGQGVQLVNADGGQYRNDLLISAQDAGGTVLASPGALYLIRNIFTPQQTPPQPCLGGGIVARARPCVTPVILNGSSGGGDSASPANIEVSADNPDASESVPAENPGPSVSEVDKLPFQE